MLGALVERHDDVGAQPDLGGDGALRAEEVRRAIEVRAKRHAFFRHLAQIAEAEDLEAARVGQDRMVPRHELLHAAKLSHHLDARPQIKVIGVVQQDLDAQLFQRVLRHALDRGQRAHGHEDGRLHLAMRREEAPGARRAIARLNLKAEGHRRRL